MNPMKRWKRLALLGLLVAIQAIYFPLNRTLYGGLMLKSPLDVYIPLWSIWVVPYTLCWPWWFACAFWAVWKMESQMYRSLFVAMLVVMVTGIAFFAFWPTYVQRPALVGHDWPTEWLRLIYTADRAYNAFPSGHIYLTTLFALYWSRWYPRQRWLWATIVVVVALSTVFTGQHYLADVAGGAVLAWGGYQLGTWWEQRWGALGFRRQVPPLVSD